MSGTGDELNWKTETWGYAWHTLEQGVPAQGKRGSKACRERGQREPNLEVFFITASQMGPCSEWSPKLQRGLLQRKRGPSIRKKKKAVLLPHSYAVWTAKDLGANCGVKLYASIHARCIHRHPIKLCFVSTVWHTISCNAQQPCFHDRWVILVSWRLHMNSEIKADITAEVGTKDQNCSLWRISSWSREVPIIIFLSEALLWPHLQQFCAVQGTPIPEKYWCIGSIEKSNGNCYEADRWIKRSVAEG